MARYTKEQIIKALECCSKGDSADVCMSGCPLWDLNDRPPCADDGHALLKYALEHLKADVVPRSEVEKLQKEIVELRNLNEIANTRLDDAIKENDNLIHTCATAIKSLKQEVAKAIIDEFEFNIEYLHECAKITGNIMFYWETLKAELEKKYIGE